MRAEIGEQPEVLRRIADEEWRAIQTVAQQIRDHEIRAVFLAARGTSDNAAAYFKYLFEIQNGIPCGLAAPSVVTMYRANLNLHGTLVVGVSQSGQAPDVVEYVAHARANGALTLSLTNDPESPLAHTSHFTLLLRAGAERSVAATKTYTGTLAVIYLLSEALRGQHDAPQRITMPPRWWSKSCSRPSRACRNSPTATAICASASRWRAGSTKPPRKRLH
jgi:glucosamine--fructose-6-phosphate aminotransferase (isomerizing)